MNEVLTRAEMEAQFDGEWVLVADPELNEGLQVLRVRSFIMAQTGMQCMSRKSR